MRREPRARRESCHGARGLLYHALAARWVVDAALSGDPALIPTPLRRGEFGALLHARLARLEDKDVERHKEAAASVR